MPTKQTTTIISSSSSHQEQQEGDENAAESGVANSNKNTNSNNNNNSHLESNKNSFLETGNVPRMRMPSGALRDIDELVYEIKSNLRLKGCSHRHPHQETRIRNGINSCCCELSVDDEGGGGSLSPGGGGKVRSSRALGGCNRLQGAPYYVHCSTNDDHGEEKTHFSSFKNWQQRHHPPCTQQQDSNDPYDLLQGLLKEGGLIKEAVRRINTFSEEDTEFIIKCFDYDKDDYEASSTHIFQPV